MRLRNLVVVVLLSSGCQQPAQPGPAGLFERPPSTGQSPGAPPTLTGADGEPQPAEAQRTPADALPEQTWSARSADGNAEVQQLALRGGKAPRCTSTSTWSSPGGERKVMWKWDTCIATREQLKFVSPDGKRVLVIDPLSSSLQPGRDWRNVEVATLYEHGVRVRGAKAGALLHAPIEVREPSLHVLWVKGQGGFPGAPPRYGSDGKAVELETVDGHSFRLGFDGEGFPAAPQEKHAFTTSGMYRYEDEQGTVHVVGSHDDVPDPYRSRAFPVEARILTVSGPLDLGEPPPSSSRPEPRPPPDEGKGPSPEHSPESARIATPAELLQQARDTVKQLEEVQRTRERLVEAQLSESEPLAGQAAPPSGSPSAAGENQSPAGPLEKARIPTPAELLERAREAVKKAQQSQSERERLVDEQPPEPQRR